MDELTKAFYGFFFDREFALRKGEAFQDFFSTIMEHRHGTDFTRLRPWGPQGDQKNDGHLQSSQIVFQCYAPNELTAATTIRKIDEDFNGAVRHWLPHMKEWVFVHNSRSGLGPDVTRKLLELQSNTHGIRIVHWGYEELKAEMARLNEEALRDIFGPVPRTSDFIRLGFDDLREVLDTIQTGPPVDSGDVRPVPPEKLEHNRLSPEIADMLQRGMTKCDLVGRYLSDVPDATLGDRIGKGIKDRYSVLRGMGLDPNAIFFELEAFCGGSIRTMPRREVAILSVLSYFFEQCDIFERPPETRE